MECDREEESRGDVFSQQIGRIYAACGDVPNFTVQGLRDALNEVESTVTEPPSLAEEFIIQLDVMMADRPGRLHGHQHIHGMEAWCGTCTEK